jgi:hypothetical protein
MSGEAAFSPAQIWRDRAAECRREAAANRSAESVAAWLRLARKYEELAERVDTEAALSSMARANVD